MRRCRASKNAANTARSQRRTVSSDVHQGQSSIFDAFLGISCPQPHALEWREIRHLSLGPVFLTQISGSCAIYRVQHIPAYSRDGAIPVGDHFGIPCSSGAECRAAGGLTGSGKASHPSAGHLTVLDLAGSRANKANSELTLLAFTSGQVHGLRRLGL